MRSIVLFRHVNDTNEVANNLAMFSHPRYSINDSCHAFTSARVLHRRRHYDPVHVVDSMIMSCGIIYYTVHILSSHTTWREYDISSLGRRGLQNITTSDVSSAVEHHKRAIRFPEWR